MSTCVPIASVSVVAVALLENSSDMVMLHQQLPHCTSLARGAITWEICYPDYELSVCFGQDSTSLEGPGSQFVSTSEPTIASVT